VLTTTWELHYAAPREVGEKEQLLSFLGAFKAKFTVMRMDFIEDEAGFSVMVGDSGAFKDVVCALAPWGPYKISVQFVEVTYDGAITGDLILDEEGDDSSSLSFPTRMRSL
jgi:hypothetical protein